MDMNDIDTIIGELKETIITRDILVPQIANALRPIAKDVSAIDFLACLAVTLGCNAAAYIKQASDIEGSFAKAAILELVRVQMPGEK